MGSKPSPPYSDIFMAEKIDEVIFYLALKMRESHKSSLLLLKRFLDDLFLIFIGSTKSLHIFYDAISKIHPNIKFTITHTSIPDEPENMKCDCETRSTIPFLDTLCEIRDGRIVTDLYRKPTDRNLYLLTSSCHPAQCFENIPFSLALRINRICSEPKDRDIRFSELKDLLISRGYRSGMVNFAIEKARKIPRSEPLKKVIQSEPSRRPKLVVSFDPRLPNIPSIQQKHWRAMVNLDCYLGEVFPEPPLTAYKRQKNIRDFLVKAKVYERKKCPKRFLKGMKKCGKGCIACPFIREGKKYRRGKVIWNIQREVTCETKNFVYLIECEKERCNEIYIGETERPFKLRLAEHKRYIENTDLTQATGNHFNQKGHNLNYMKATILEKVKNHDTNYRKQREQFLINKFNSFRSGMNKMP